MTLSEEGPARGSAQPDQSRTAEVTTATQALEDILQEFTRCLRIRSTDEVLRLFADDVIWFGSAAHEHARGLAQLRRFLADDVFKRPYTVEWVWEPPLVAVSGQVAWFVAPTIAVLHHDDGNQTRLVYRMSGVIEHVANGRWVIKLFNGAEPARSADAE
ncbi:YybH family protein [Nonomuraea zeae]|uniref:SnoaL-like domain-containing protein n=1 Tax=Nonomuraea zeae TaxID=1642303 RepID=A0A5S4G5D0_9ACTN|nr:nuclear transport factor 2 family protein [Nonomuraea zeae]TMR28052.1 hypothetical protein ETD85_37175 [Nonomuraea zeae]